MTPTRQNPPVVLLGGRENALAVLRSLARRGVRVVLAAAKGSAAAYSRHCSTFEGYADGILPADFWSDLLLSDSARYDGHILLSTTDEGLEFIACNHAALGRRYILDHTQPDMQLAMLDKQRTLLMAREAGVATPDYWSVTNAQELAQAVHESRYPALVKPVHSHLFKPIFGRKHFIVRDAKDLRQKAELVLESGAGFMICEMIPGPDSLLSSYYSYYAPDGEQLFRFTKRVLRRYPQNQGGASYHATEWLPDTAKAGDRFFRGIGFQGLGNVEFKLDRRDGHLKLIECNARFTAAQPLLVRAGIDTAWIVYCQLSGRPVPRINGFREQLHYWYPDVDYLSFKELRREGKLTTGGWLRSLARPKVTPYYCWNDPMPSLVQLYRIFRDRLV